ncbi:hypothetical protein ANOM_008144 [Aspergillus nomiae NRRL 13137]|uniref:DUF6924 domain-containing protein n=1 Tax=Aspergillus nomiae NRRL (strain ATCC 15546 / NRRL 13137 / CBS 260.88 / M93) TaxID=1509407 RepID=A0A0L1IXL3_ASPN3|nr:uncharacterized protein ANOM_008144 [Aspergillus nomiae NRRL 13137]KNG83908.1 hypothetical protein ANOM_008144 [Aspergillus nomiae NRRL 13137]
MSESLIPIFCLHDIPPQMLTSILTKAYAHAIDINSPPTLLLVESTGTALRRYTRDAVTYPPVDSAFKSPFNGWELDDVVRFLREYAMGTVVDESVFLVADGRTVEDESLLLVQSLHGDPMQSVRLAAEYVNTKAVAVAVAATGVQELRSLVDGDGVFRGGGDNPSPRKGGKAPRKQLAGSG